MSRLTWSLILINVIIFEILFSMPEKMMHDFFVSYSFSSQKLFEIWRIITSLFLHASASHLFFNMLGLYFFGRIVEKEAGWKKTTILYFLSGIFGNLLYSMFSSLPVVGASGCVFGLMGDAMFIKPKEMIKLYFFPLPLGIIALLFALVETMLVYFGEMASGVAHVAHVGGLIIGVLFAFFTQPKKSLKGFLWLLL
ncbi:MAG: rhomboid family intramembrane serine protease, partial [Candidatus Aenigmatarchaeota archaeon]